MPVSSQDHVAAALALLLAQFRGKPGIEALLGGLVTPMTAIEADAFDLMAGRIGIDVAEGVQLDLIGELLKVARPTGMSDVDFRGVLQKEIQLHASNGTTDDIIAVALDVVSGWGVATIEASDARAEFEAQARRSSDGAVMPYDAITGGPGWTEEEFNAVWGYLNRARAAGVYFVLLARTAIVEAAWSVTVTGDAPSATGEATFGGDTYDVFMWKGEAAATITVDSVGPGVVHVGVVGEGGPGIKNAGGGGGSGGAVFGQLAVPHVVGDAWDVEVAVDGTATFDHGSGVAGDLVSAAKGGEGGSAGAGVSPLAASEAGILTSTTVLAPGAGGGGAAGGAGGAAAFGGTAGGAADATKGGGGGGSTGAGQLAAAGGDGGDGTDLSAGIYGALLSAVGLGAVVCAGGGGGNHSPAASGGSSSAGGDGGVAPAGTGLPGQTPGSGGGGSASSTSTLGFAGVVLVAIPQGTGAPDRPHVPFAFDGFRSAGFDGVNVGNPTGGNFQIRALGARGLTPE